MLSVVILNYDIRELLSECIRCVQRNVEGLEHEIILVDNGSKDGSLEFVRKNFNDIKIVANKKNIGASGGRNKGILSSTGEYILSIDSDTFPNDNCVPILLKEISDFSDIGAIGCKLLNSDGSIQYSAKRFPTITSEFLNIFLFSRFFSNTRYSQIIKVPDGVTQQVHWVSSALILFRREAIFKAGLFDERFFYGGDDADIMLQIKKAAV